MTWTYNLADINTTQLYQVRFYIGDTDHDDQLLQDEEINFAVSQIGSIWGAAATCSRSIEAKFARLADQASGQSKLFYSQRAKAYHQLALDFDGKLAERGGGLPYVGGISIADKQNRDANQDRVQPAFVIGADDSTLPVTPLAPDSPDFLP